VALGLRRARAQKRPRPDEPYFAGHYPGHPIYPGVFIVEAVLQAARALLDAEGQPGRLAEVVSARFLAPVQPGDALQVDCELARGEAAGEVVARAVCCIGRTKVANVKLRFQREGGDA